MTKLVKSSLVAALILSTSLSAVTFDYSGEGGFTNEDGTYTVVGDPGIAGTFTFDEYKDTSTVGGNIEGQPQLWYKRASEITPTAYIFPMVSWSESAAGANEPPADGKSALGLVPYYNGIDYGEATPYVAKIDSDGPMKRGGGMTHYNITVTQGGLIVPTIEWKFKIWEEDKSGTDAPIWESDPMQFLFAEWETDNDPGDATEPKDPVDTSITPAGHCPNEFSGLMTDPMSEAAIGTAIPWTGLADNQTDCDDAARYDGDTERKEIGSFPYDGKEYKVYMSGFYKCDDSAGIYHDVVGACAIQDTFWQAEFQNDTAYVMLEVEEVPPGDQGCTPGYWKQDQHFDSWPNPPYAGDLFDDVYGCGPEITLAAALALKGGGENALIRHSVAALLNTASTDVNYPNVGNITEETCAALESGDKTTMNTLKDIYEGHNEGPEDYEGEWCPLD